MPMENQIVGAVSGTGADVNASRQMKVVSEVDAAANPGNVGGTRIFGENDQGAVTGVPRLASGEVDIDYRSRVSQDLLLDYHIFNSANIILAATARSGMVSSSVPSRSIITAFTNSGGVNFTTNSEKTL